MGVEFGCGGLGLRTSNGRVVNLYFWHIERSRDRFVRAEEFLGRADSESAKRELLQRMVAYNRRVENRLARQTRKLERLLVRLNARTPAVRVRP